MVFLVAGMRHWCEFTSIRASSEALRFRSIASVLFRFEFPPFANGTDGRVKQGWFRLYHDPKIVS